jgi:hypothetical protein
VALAAGLEAAAGNYVPTQEGLAQASETAARAKGLGIQNQMSQQTLDEFTKMMKSQNAPSPASPIPMPQNIGPTPISPAEAPGYYQNKYLVNPTMPQQTVQDIANAKFLDAKMGTNFTAGKQLAFQNSLQQAKFNSQNAAQRDYDRLVNGVVNASANGESAYSNLKQINPGLADGLARQIKLDPTNQDTWTDQQKQLADTTAAKIAAAHAAMIHQYTGSDYKTEAGTQYDARTNTTPVGPAAQKLSPEQTTQGVLNSLGTEDTGAPARPTKAQIAQQTGVTIPNLPAATPKTSVAPAAGASSNPGSGAAPKGSVPAVAGAPLESKYQLPPAPAATVAQTPQTKARWEAIIKKNSDLLDDADALTSSSQEGLMYTNAAQALMASHGNVTGLGAGAKAQISRALSAAGITKGVDATNYQELSKLLGSIAVQNFKQNFGARPAAKEFDIQMNQLNPGVDMQDDAINGLLGLNERNFKYSLDTAHRVSEFTNHGGNPQKFYDWNNTHFPRTQVVNEGIPRPGQQTSGPVSVSSRADAMKLAPGTIFITPDGRTLVR